MPFFLGGGGGEWVDNKFRPRMGEIQEKFN